MQENNEFLQWVAGTSVGGMVLAFLARFTYRKFIEEGTATQRAGAEGDIIKGLRDELARVTEANENLSRKMIEMQEELLLVHGELHSLKLRMMSMGCLEVGVKDAGT